MSTPLYCCKNQRDQESETDMKVQITNGMLMALVINMVYAKAIGLTQGIMAREAGGDIWIATIFATIQGFLIMWLTVKVIQRTPDKNIMEHVDHLFGKWAGKLVAILMIGFFIGAFATVMITFVYHLMDYFLPEIPVIVFVIVAVIVGMYAVYHGLEVVARLALVGVFSVIALNVLLMMGSYKDFDIRELMPVFQSGFVNTVWTSRHNDTDWAMATLMAAMLLPHVKDKKTWKKSAPIALLYAGMTVLMWPILEAGVLSPEVTGQYIVACMQMARSAEVGLFIHRYEMIMVAFFASSILVMTAMTMFCASVATAHVFELRDYRPVIIPVSLVLGGVGYWIVLDHNQAMRFLADTWPTLAMSVAFGVPVLVYLFGFFRKKKWAKEEQVEKKGKSAA